MLNFIKLALPIILTYLGQTAMNFVDMIFVGQIDSAAVGAVGVGSSIFIWFLVFGLGLLSGMEYLVSHAHGAKNHERQRDYLIQGVWIALGMSIPLTFVLLLLSQHLEWFRINAEVLGPAKDYTRVVSWSLFSAYFFSVFRLYLTAQGLGKPAMIMLIVGNIMNAAVDAVLVPGLWGFPRMGAVGAAWATTASRIVMMIGLGAYLLWFESKKGRRLALSHFAVHWNRMRELMRVGLPSALQMVFEVGIFAFATTLAGQLTADALAAHQVVLNIASLTFMVPLGMSSAVAVMIGQSLGRKEPEHAIKAGWTAFMMGVGFMAVSSVSLLIFPNRILGFFSTSDQVVEIGKSILLIAAFFQISDGIQTIGTGALRGFGDTKSAMILNLIGHWGVGLPLGASLCFSYQFGIRGLWIGLSAGLTLIAIGVFSQWLRQVRKLA